MRKLIPYLLILYPLILVSVMAYSRLTPAPPPPPPSKWDIFWCEHGDIVAAGLIIMLSLLELAVGVFAFGGVLVLLKKGWTIWAHSVGRSGGLAPVIRDKRGEWLDVNPEGAVIAAAIAAHAPKVTAAMARNMMGSALGVGRWNVQDTTYADIPEEPLPQGANLPRLVSIYDTPSLQQPALPIGVTEEGHLELPLHNLGNGLVGGLPGGGKSELLASMMVSLMRYSPDGRQVQIAVIDTKRVDFGNIPPDIATLWHPVAREVDDGKEIIAMLGAEADRRFMLLEKHRARSLRSYNVLSDVETLPYLVMFIDEIADWAGDKEFEKLAILIGRKGRAAGITLVAATQRTGAKEISSSLRAVMGFAVAFRTRNNTDSRLILGESGAENISINDKGRCLVWTGERLLMAQAYYADIDGGRFDQFTLSLPKKSAVLAGANAGFQSGSSGLTPGSRSGSGGTSSGSSGIFSGSDAVRTGLNPQKRTISGQNPGNSTSAVRTGTSKNGIIQFDPREYVRNLALRNERDGVNAVISYNSAKVVYGLYKRYGAIKPLQRHLWPNVSTGGHRFYWLRDIIEQMENRPRTRPTVTVIFPNTESKDAKQKSGAQS